MNKFEVHMLAGRDLNDHAVVSTDGDIGNVDPTEQQ